MKNNIHNLTTAVTLTAAIAAGNTQPANAEINSQVGTNEAQEQVDKRTHYIGSLSISPLQAETPLPTTTALQNCIDKTEVYSFTEYAVNRKGLGTIAVSRAPAECAAITEVPIILQASKRTGGVRGSGSRISYVSKPVEVKDIQTTGIANIASDQERRRRTTKRANVVVKNPLTSKDARSYGMVTKHQVVPRSPQAIDPATGAVVPSPVGAPKSEATRANPWLVIPKDAKRSTKKPWRISSDQAEYLDKCNLLGVVSEQYPNEKSKYMKVKFISGPHEDTALDTYVVKFKNAKVCKGGGMVERRGDKAVFGFKANRYTQTWASFHGGYLPGYKEVAAVAFTGLIDGTKPKKFGAGI